MLACRRTPSSAHRNQRRSRPVVSKLALPALAATPVPGFLRGVWPETTMVVWFIPSAVTRLNSVAAWAGESRTQPCETGRPRCFTSKKKSVNGMTSHVEENCVRHRRIVPFLRQVVGVHAVSLENAVWSIVAGAPG